jgi:hypothetical protein
MPKFRRPALKYRANQKPQPVKKKEDESKKKKEK